MYTLKTINGRQVLHREGSPVKCPFITGAWGQNNLGQTGVLLQDCSSACALFDIQNEGHRVKLHCGTGPEFITVPETEKNTTNAKILTLNGK